MGDFQQLNVKLSLGSKAKPVDEGKEKGGGGNLGFGYQQRILRDLQQAGVWFLETMLKCHNIRRNDCDRRL